jgi:hypothetical protein
MLGCACRLSRTALECGRGELATVCYTDFNLAPHVVNATVFRETLCEDQHAPGASRRATLRAEDPAGAFRSLRYPGGNTSGKGDGKVKRHAVLMFLLISLAVAACGQGETSEGTTEADLTLVVEEYVEIASRLDTPDYSTTFCEAVQEAGVSYPPAFENLYRLRFEWVEPEDEAVILNMDRVSYQVKSQTDDTAVVHMAGRMSLEYDADRVKSAMREHAELTGGVFSAELYEGFIERLDTWSEGEVHFEKDMSLAKESGKWVICDEDPNSFLDGLDDLVD